MFESVIIIVCILCFPSACIGHERSTGSTLALHSAVVRLEITIHVARVDIGRGSLQPRGRSDSVKFKRNQIRHRRVVPGLEQTNGRVHGMSPRPVQDPVQSGCAEITFNEVCEFCQKHSVYRISIFFSQLYFYSVCSLYKVEIKLKKILRIQNRFYQGWYKIILCEPQN